MDTKSHYPHMQPFNVDVIKNKTKRNAWWQHAPFHNNKKEKAK